MKKKKERTYYTIRYFSLLEQDNGDGCIDFRRNDESFLKLNDSEQSFRVQNISFVCYLV